MCVYFFLLLGLMLVLLSNVVWVGSCLEYVGMLEFFVSDVVYFVVIDWFVNGDLFNDYCDQGGKYCIFDIFVLCVDKVDGNIGYLGGDFKGVFDNVVYICNFGFGVVWIIFIVDNLDEVFIGSKLISCISMFIDCGKIGYYGYWGVNFYRVDEYLFSKDLDFVGFICGLYDVDLKVVLDIVVNYGFLVWMMLVKQLQFGQIFDKDGIFIVDYQNLLLLQFDLVYVLLYRFYNIVGFVDGKDGLIFDGNLVELGDFNQYNLDVMDYLVGVYLQWVVQGVDVLCIDIIGWLLYFWWYVFVNCICVEYLGMFMFGEVFDYDVGRIVEYIWFVNVNVSVLDFLLCGVMLLVFGKEQKGFQVLVELLYLFGGLYVNLYVLMSFYDNYDMVWLDVIDNGFIDVYNWLFIVCGILVLYYGLEIGFMCSCVEYVGNCVYFGQVWVDVVLQSLIFGLLQCIVCLCQIILVLQCGLQVNECLQGDEVVFYCVLQYGDVVQMVLVLFNKGDVVCCIEVCCYLQFGMWCDVLGQGIIEVGVMLKVEVFVYGVWVFVFDVLVVQKVLEVELQWVVDDQQVRICWLVC